MNMSLEKIADLLDGTFASAANAPAPALVVPGGAQVDSRLVRPGDLFFCLPGEKTDGHAFAHDAAKAGAAGIIALHDPFAQSGRPQDEPRPPVLLVADVKQALWTLAMAHRDRTGARVIGLTGTAGKTTVKEVLAHVLAGHGKTERNPVNLNSQTGLPVSMLCASAQADFWVMELGISQAHDMDELGAILRPDVGLILNVGIGHTLGLGERGVAANKALLLDYIRPGGLAVVSADYPDLEAEVQKRLPVLAGRGIGCARFSARFAAGPDETVVAADYAGPAGPGGGRYRVRVGREEYTVQAPFQGAFGAENVAAVMAVAAASGLEPERAGKGFSGAVLPGQRFCVRRHGRFVVVDDSYNANPLSTRRMVLAARDMAREEGLPLVLVMGEMLELGELAYASHEELGALMAEAGADIVFWKGGNARAVAAGLQRGGYGKSFYPVGGGQEFSLLLEEVKLHTGLVLFKGSRGTRLERLLDIFLNGPSLAGEADAV